MFRTTPVPNGSCLEAASGTWRAFEARRLWVCRLSVPIAKRKTSLPIMFQGNETVILFSFHWLWWSLYRLPLSLDNTLIFFLHLKVGEGVFLAPSQQENACVFHLQRLLFENFRSAIELIHGLMQRTRTTTASDNGKWTSRSLVTLKEQVKDFRGRHENNNS